MDFEKLWLISSLISLMVFIIIYIGGNMHKSITAIQELIAVFLVSFIPGLNIITLILALLEAPEYFINGIKKLDILVYFIPVLLLISLFFI